MRLQPLASKLLERQLVRNLSVVDKNGVIPRILDTRDNSDVIIAANHIGPNDGHLITGAVGHLLTSPSQRIHRTSSEGYVRQKLGRTLMWKVIAPILLNYNNIPVYKEHDYPDPSTRHQLNQSAFWDTLTNETQPYTWIVFPEGYASPTVTQAKNGITKIATERGEDTRIIPLALTQSKKPTLRNQADNFNITIGHDFTVRQARSNIPENATHSDITTYIMGKIADMLPHDEKGFYT